jgi:cellobiose-specific phosphotransferase system component IIB
MPEIKNEELTEEELLALLERNLDAADTYQESLIGEQRDKAHRYYYGEPLGNEIRGRSQHVSRDVFDAVESTKALMLDTFTADRRVVEFMPQTNEDVEKARQATAWVNYLFYRQNNGYQILHDTVHDGLVAKMGIVKRWWDSRITYVEERFAGLSEPEFFGLASQPDVEITEIEQETLQEAVVDPINGMLVAPAVTIFGGKLKRRIDKSQVRVENVEPERFYISPRAKTLESADFVSYRMEKEIGELLEDGYDPDKVEKLDEELDSYRDSTTGRDSYDEFSENSRMSDDHPNRSFVTVYESYLRIYDPEVDTRVTVKVIHSKRVMLDMEKVECHPFRAWCPFPVPHKAIGLSLADVLLDIQKSQSSLKRSVIDNAFMTNTTRWLANLSLVRNPRDLIDNKVGAVIDVNAMDPAMVVQPLNVPQISPNVFTTMELMEQEKEQRSGSSRMSKGLDSDVISKQNSSDLITRYMNASNRRTMVMARNFAECFLKPLMYDLYRLSIENDTQPKMIQLEGQFVQIDPRELYDRTEMEVAVALTPDARAAEARTLTMLDQMWTANPQDPTLGGMYQVPQRYALLARAMDLMGLKGADKYLLSPMSPEYQQGQQQQQQMAQQREQMAQQFEMKKIELEERKVVVDEQKGQLDAAKLQIDEDRLLLDIQVAKNDFILKAQKTGDEAEKFDTDTALHAMELRHRMKVETIQAENQRMAMEGKD